MEHFKKRYAAKMERLRQDYPHAVQMRRVVECKKYASKEQVKKCKAYFAYADCLINKNVAYFKNPEDAVYFRMGMWL